MDLKMNAEDITSAGVSWDCTVKDGDVPIISDNAEEVQNATLAGFLIVGTVPQLPDAGVPWTDFITNKITFGVLDFYIRDSLRAAGKEDYYPQYDIEDDQLTMKVGKVVQEENNGI